MFRLADAYLIYAEAQLRGGGGDRAQALAYVNALRQRAYGNASGNITDAELTLRLHPRRAGTRAAVGGPPPDRPGPLRPVHRRRLFWAVEGRSGSGRATESFRDLYPLPASELIANPNLMQNPGY